MQIKLAFLKIRLSVFWSLNGNAFNLAAFSVTISLAAQHQLLGFFFEQLLLLCAVTCSWAWLFFPAKFIHPEKWHCWIADSAVQQLWVHVCLELTCFLQNQGSSSCAFWSRCWFRGDLSPVVLICLIWLLWGRPKSWDRLMRWSLQQWGACIWCWSLLSCCALTKTFVIHHKHGFTVKVVA